MAKMFGPTQWWNAGCSCCHSGRTRGQQRMRERRQWRREAAERSDPSS